MAKKSSPNDPVCKLLKRGKQRIAKGWTRRSLYRMAKGKVVGYCALGALTNPKENKAFNEWSPVEMAAREALSNNLQEVNGYKALTIAYFNDDQAKSKRDVIALYDRAIASRCKVASK